MLSRNYRMFKLFVLMEENSNNYLYVIITFLMQIITSKSHIRDVRGTRLENKKVIPCVFI